MPLFTGQGVDDDKRRRKYEAERYDEAKQLFQNKGVAMREDAFWKYVVGVRKETYSAQKSNRGGLYDDYIWVVYLDKDGVKHADGFDVNTEPSAYYEGNDGEDADSDGRRDLGRLPLGLYEYYCNLSRSKKLGMVFRPVNAASLERDIDHNGYFTDADTQLIQKPNLMIDTSKSILFHQGATSRTGSAGCQTFPPSQFIKFKQEMINRNKNQVTFYYLLVAIG